MKHLNIQTFQLGLLGYPVSHSLSPKIHAVAMHACGLEGDYSLFPVHPDEYQGLKNLLDRVRNNEIHGLNVTIPHKQNVISLLDDLTPTAKAIGAVNTIFLKNGKLIGDNTDAPGFLSVLQKFLNTKSSNQGGTKSALVLGAGGAARAVVYALVNAGWNVWVAARRLEQAHDLVTKFPDPNSKLQVAEYQKNNLQALVSNLSLLVNTTPLGMSPDIDTSPWPDDLPFPPHAAVYDLVYNPCETKFVKDAHATGLPATTGLGMLIEQAALSFEIWTGCNPSREILWNAVNCDT